MANEIQISAVTGLSLSVQLYIGSTPVGSTFSATEIGSTGEYITSMPAVGYGKYLAVVTVGSGVKIGSGEIFWDGNYELIDSLAKLEGLDSGNPMTVTQSSRVAGDINLVITGNGETSTTVTAS